MVHVEILNQLGGNRFIAMIGSKNLTYSEKENNYLQMRLTKNIAGATFLKITLNSMDTYDMEFIKVRTSKLGEYKRTIVKEFKGVYNDMLQNLFTQVTGLRTTL